ncbi:MAG: ammonium transporter [Rhodobiaceae bacterium]|jgi:Amt family ammonium transporter|nr:ammonium transporter [Rhodobiaceae bacterium]MBT5640450.1 ammonium transporter [Rhodobiaceae bacterium]MBT6222904.1 ammonium transporter [Rhodobiaceae bacterium]MDB4831924.1 ammonium transporter [Hyphomicrobiales bacterium]MDC3272474.1 ammonium transporter [Hyphomicrobiales bacterium]
MFDSGDTAWILTSTALVLLMTMPGLALFYAGLVRSRNILSVLMHCSAICCVSSVLWFALGYSLAFTEGGAYIGSLSNIFLLDMARDAATGTIPESVFFSFQMTFAVITPALIVGAYVERIKFGAVLLFSSLWLLLVYVPVCHWVWGGGWLADMGVMDFAGGIVVHVTAGISALVIAIVLGNRSKFPDQISPPHAPWMVMVGAAMLWIGWFGFNAGSALSAGSDAGMAMLVTHLSAATASLVWLTIEWIRFGKPSLIGLVTGTIAGLATVTPASGFIGPIGGLICGLVGGGVCYYCVDLIKVRFNIDDSLDVFAVHGVGGATGTLLIAFLALESMSGVGLEEGVSSISQLKTQIIGIGSVLVWSIAVTLAIIYITRRLVGLRVESEDELEGLDYKAHGETGYNL